MDIWRFQELVKDEVTAKRYFRTLWQKKYRVFCHACGSRQSYLLSDGRRRCKRCRCVFHEGSGRWINLVKLSCREWLWVIHLFELNSTARTAGKKLKLSYPTVLKAYDVIRMALLDSTASGRELLLSGEIELDESYFGGKRKGKRGRGAAGKVPVFGLLERDGVACVEVVPDVSAQTLLSLTIKKVKRGSIVYTYKFHSYDSLMCCGYRHLTLDHGSTFAKGKVYINGLEGFWSYAKERLIKHHGVSKHKFFLYLKELEFRYNNREADLFSLIARCLLNFGPKRL